ncbi:hypothetical protein D9619_007220 [Psilocybe cf. subviscida]|uniref:Uncharacterized protein n=1 Tax=Psilocybe cf. subviscida TaxID=2480587 RepID=A0A8H5B3T1_9AGAR|nr:hypothetical protein D9619_007220 [Psilocybe cf. subviscida]
MDADLGWCPNCEHAILPKRKTITVTVPVTTKGSQPPPPPPSSPRSRKAAANQRKGGLVNGTGRLRPNGTIRTPSPAQPLPATREKKKLVIDHSPLPLYCSEECRIADIELRRRTAPFNPESDDPEDAPPKVKSRRGEGVEHIPSDPESAGDSDSSLDQLPILWDWQKPAPPPPLPSVNKLFAFMPSVNIDHIPEPATTTPKYIPSPQYNGGNIMTGRLLNSIAPDPIKPRQYRWDPLPERHAPVKGWNDGSEAWRDALYGNGCVSGMDTDPYGRTAKEHQRVTGGIRPVPIRPDPAGKFISGSLLTDAAIKERLEDPTNLRFTTNQMLGRMNDALSQRASSRSNMYAPGPHRTTSAASVASATSDAGSVTSNSPPSPTVMRRERSLLSPGAEGKLLVPNVKLSVRSSSASCLSSSSTDPIPISRRSSSSNSGSSQRSSRTKRSTTARSPLGREHASWLGPHLSSSLEDEAAEKEQNREDDDEEIEIGADGKETKHSAEKRRLRRESRRHLEVFEREERERERLFGGALTSIRPVQTTRSLSFDNMQVYDAMPMPEGKPLFRFAPKTVRIAP